MLFRSEAIRNRSEPFPLTTVAFRGPLSSTDSMIANPSPLLSDFAQTIGLPYDFEIDIEPYVQETVFESSEVSSFVIEIGISFVIVLSIVDPTYLSSSCPVECKTPRHTASTQFNRLKLRRCA